MYSIAVYHERVRSIVCCIAFHFSGPEKNVTAYQYNFRNVLERGSSLKRSNCIPAWSLHSNIRIPPNSYDHVVCRLASRHDHTTWDSFHSRSNNLFNDSILWFIVKMLDALRLHMLEKTTCWSARVGISGSKPPCRRKHDNRSVRNFVPAFPDRPVGKKAFLLSHVFCQM